MLYLKTNKILSIKTRAIAIFILLATSGFFFGQSQERQAQEISIQKTNEQARRLALEKQKDIYYFNQNSSKIISEAKSALESKEYQKVISICSKYLISGNQNLADIYNEAKNNLEEIQRVEERKKAEVRAKMIEFQKAVEKEKAEEKAKLEEHQRSVEEKRRKDEVAACRQDLDCWGKKFKAKAEVKCEDGIEHLAKYSYKWTGGFLGQKFSLLRWKNQQAGIIIYIGDKIEFQNGFGAWQNYIYECDFDTNTETVLSTQADPGRL